MLANPRQPEMNVAYHTRPDGPATAGRLAYPILNQEARGIDVVRKVWWTGLHGSTGFTADGIVSECPCDGELLIQRFCVVCGHFHYLRTYVPAAPSSPVRHAGAPWTWAVTAACKNQGRLGSGQRAVNFGTTGARMAVGYGPPSNSPVGGAAVSVVRGGECGRSGLTP